MKAIIAIALLNLCLLSACGGGTPGTNTNATNTLGVAVAGTTMEVARNTSFSLDGSGSSDVNGDILTYTWTQTLGPDVTNGAGFLSGEVPTITAPVDVSTLKFSLIVNDGQADSAPDTVQINVMEQPAEAVFVDGDNGSDTSGDGSRLAPYASILHALSNLPVPNYDLYVKTMNSLRYKEFGATTSTSPDAISLTVPDGTSLYGGFGTDWVRDVDANRTPLWTGSRGINFVSVNQNTWFSGFSLESDNGSSWNQTESFGIAADSGTATLYILDNDILSGDVISSSGSSYGLRLANLGAVRILRNLVSSGNGGNSIAGQDGLNGHFGGHGSNATGQNGAREGFYGFCAWGSGTTCRNLELVEGASASINGGNGGAGGGVVFGNGNGGARGFKDGDKFHTPTGASGGTGGVEFNQTGKNGSGGFGGFSKGQGGNGGNGQGSISNGGFVNNSAKNGQRGGHGGGGGGGSEGEFIEVGNGGGGGGVGGQGGTAGGNGGASIGILVAGIADVLIEDNIVTSANGGGGAAGGDMGEGGNGGNGGSGASISKFSGGKGGGGGHGGQGGQGGAGGGGPSYSIFVGSNMAPDIIQNTLQTGVGGAPGSDGAGDNGGARGGRWGNVGTGSGTGATGYHSTARASDGSLAEGGWSYTIYDINPFDGLVPNVNNNNSFPGTAGSRGQAGIQNF